MVRSNFRFAAGVCVLATGLWLGGAGGVIAVAGADSHGSGTHSHDGANGSSQGSSAAGPVSSPPTSITNTVPQTLQGVTATRGSGPKSGLPGSTGVPQTLPGGTNIMGIVGPQNDPNPVAAPSKQIPNPVVQTPPVAQIPNAAAPNAPVAAAPNVGKQNPSPVAQIPKAAAPVTNALAAVTNAGGPPAGGPPASPNPLAPAANPLGPALNSLGPLALSVINLVTDSANVFAVTLVTDVANGTVLTSPVADLVEAIPILLAPALDAITVLQDVVITVATVAHDVLPLTFQLPSDIASLFGITLGLPPVVGPQSDVYPPTLATVASVPTAPSAASPLSLPPAPLAPADIPDGPMAGSAAGLATLGGIATSHVSPGSSPDQAAPTPFGARIEQALGRVGQAIGAALRSVSLAELAAAALPGLGGLLIFTGAGVRAGHRQAKFGFAVQTAGIARFARMGPLGVVRSGHLVAIRRRKARAECRLDEAA